MIEPAKIRAQEKKEGSPFVLLVFMSAVVLATAELISPLCCCYA